jgi:MFS transporter, PAT family, beta-lactamase induction signal transducer AmpG
MSQTTENDPADLRAEEEALESNLTEGHSPKSPWWYVPSLYFMQGVPVMIVQALSVTMYKKMGVPNDQIGLWTSLIAWPWIVKMLWGPLVDGNGTKRAWVVATQALIIAALGGVAYSVTQPGFFAISLGLLFVVAFLSATHDIAADGFYLLALHEKRQALFVGIRSASFRLAIIFVTGMLVGIAGKLEAEGMPIPQTWTTALSIGVVVYALFFAYNCIALPKPAADRARAPVRMDRILFSFGQVMLMLLGVFLVGRLIVIGAAQANALLPSPQFTKSVELTPLFLPVDEGHAERVLESYAREDLAKSTVLASASEVPRVVARALAGQFAPGAAAVNAEELGEQVSREVNMPAEDQRQAVQKLVAGVSARPSPFATRNFFMPYVFQLMLSLGIIALAIWSTRRLFLKIGMGPAARTYFTQSGIVPILGFILFYRFGESMISKMSSPFLLDPPERGGLGVATQAVGVITGTIGVLGLVVGGLLGAWVISRFGIKRSLWPMVLALNLPNFFYIWLAYQQQANPTAHVSPLSQMIADDTIKFATFDPPKWLSDISPVMHTVSDFIVDIPAQFYNLFLLLWQGLQDRVGQVILIDQFGYGFGFSAYMVYLMFISQTTKRYQTSHYAISTGLMALGAMVAGIASGYLQVYFAGPPDSPNPLAYAHFFIAVVICTIPGMLTLFFIPMKGEDIKEAQIDID